MDDYISRKALLEKAWNVDTGCELVQVVDVDDILEAPAADVVEVTRCKDCKWFADNNGGEWYGCQMFHVIRVTPEDAPKPDDFCSYGKRK